MAVAMASCVTFLTSSDKLRVYVVVESEAALAARSFGGRRRDPICSARKGGAMFDYLIL